MRWTWLCMLLTFTTALKGSHAVFKRGVRNCGSRPYLLNMTQPRPSALSDPVFRDPWIKNNVAVTYDALITSDGLGSQLHRQLAVYAVAACAGLQYIHTTRFLRFSHMHRNESQQLAHRVNTLLGVPSKPVAVSRSWKVVDLDRDCTITWDTLLNETKKAVVQRTPTLFNVSFTYGFALTYPAMLQCVPAFQQQAPRCGQPLLRPVRVAVHIRSGDALDPLRLLPHSYFFNVIKVVTKALRHLQRDYLIEVYTQAANAVDLHENGTRNEMNGTQYVQHLQLHLGPHMVMLADHDLAWTFSQMATADIFVHSRSTLSISAGIMNTQGINIAPPEGSLPWPWLQASHWLHPANVSGVFSPQGHQHLVSMIRQRFGPPCRSRLFDLQQPTGARGQPQQQQQQQQPRHHRPQHAKRE